MKTKKYRTQILRATETVYRKIGKPSVTVRVNAEEDPDHPCYDYEAMQAPSAAREAARRFILSLGIPTTIGLSHSFHVIVRVWVLAKAPDLWFIKDTYTVDLSSGLNDRKARALP